jgi:ribosome-binding ATPase YchF (GTP1/OBG family)
MLIGVVGKPSTGKSTFFKASTLAEVDIANYPFTTIKPNHAVGFVKIQCADKFFEKQCNPRTGHCVNHNRFVPVEMLDVAGLVPGASEGKGMGNSFLDDLNQAHALIHVIDVSGSTNENGEPVEPLSYDPCNDVRFLENELDQWFLRIMSKGWDKFMRQVRTESLELYKAIAKQLSGLGVTEDISKNCLKGFSGDLSVWSDEDMLKFARLLREKTKPIIIAANKIDVPGAEKNFERLVETFPNYKILGCSAESELALKEANKKGLIEYIPGEDNFKIVGNLDGRQKAALDFIEKNVLARFGTGVQQVLNYAVFDLLDYIAIYPGGVSKLEDSEGRVLPDCFLMKNGCSALDFAYRLHTDLGKGFIRAIDVKTRRTVGKEHLLKHCDVVEIVSSK